jgi:hypothetical protein
MTAAPMSVEVDLYGPPNPSATAQIPRLVIAVTM